MREGVGITGLMWTVREQRASEQSCREEGYCAAVQYWNHAAKAICILKRCCWSVKTYSFFCHGKCKVVLKTSKRFKHDASGNSDLKAVDRQCGDHWVCCLI